MLQIEVTNALINSGPAAIRLTEDTKLTWAEDTNYPFNYGSPIVNDVPGLRVVVDGAGCAHNNSVNGAGPDPTTQAVGIDLYECTFEMMNLNIGTAAKFKVGAEATAQTDSAGNPDYSTTGRHFVRTCNLFGFQAGLRLHGDDPIIRDVQAGAGGGSVQFRPIAFDIWGHYQHGDNTRVTLVKGPNDLEMMGYHLEDAGGSVWTSMAGNNPIKQAATYGVWFNSTDKVRLVDFSFSHWDIVFAGDAIADGWGRGHVANYNTLNNVHLTLELT